jgi:hypothetical protein
VHGLALLIAVATGTLLLDQASKELATALPVEGLLVNSRASVLRLSQSNAAALWLLVAACAVLLATVADPLAAAGLGLALGGATGNLADRLVRGGVVDFISVGRWPTFNLADAAMVCGVAAAVWSLA